MKRMKFKSFISGALVTLLALSLIGGARAAVTQKQATLNYSGIQITLDGQKVTPKDANGNSVEPFAIDGTTYLPVRAVADALGLEVGWDQATQTVLLTAPEEQRAIYITRTGSKYHHDSTCNGGTYWPVPLDTAVGMGLEPCEKCVH